MNKKTIQSNLLLLLTALIWGFAFVAQRASTDYLGAFTFNGIRFALGAISLLPIILFRNKKSENLFNKSSIFAGFIIGIFLFLGSTFQQLGIFGTSSGKAAFITGTYVVFVPLLQLFFHSKVRINSWIASILAVLGLYLLTLSENFTISYYDILELIGALCFALHIIIVEHYSQRFNSLILSFIQFITCSALSMIIVIFFENINLSNIYESAIPILYGGIFSVGVAYTLQIVGQKNTSSSNASLILSLESVFAVLGGFLILGEQMTLRQSLGCILIFIGILLAQINFNKN